MAYAYSKIHESIIMHTLSDKTFTHISAYSVILVRTYSLETYAGERWPTLRQALEAPTEHVCWLNPFAGKLPKSFLNHPIN
jgi:hypothetical protein